MYYKKKFFYTCIIIKLKLTYSYVYSISFMDLRCVVKDELIYI